MVGEEPSDQRYLDTPSARRLKLAPLGLCLVIATDGVMDDFMPPYGKLENLYEFLRPLYTANQPAHWLLDWLGYERRGSFDDRTLVALVPNKRQGVKIA